MQYKLWWSFDRSTESPTDQTTCGRRRGRGSKQRRAKLIYFVLQIHTKLFFTYCVNDFVVLNIR